MTKRDAILSLIIGFFIGLFFSILLLTLQFQNLLMWTILIICPILATFSLFLASFLEKRFLPIYQFAKFLLVGALNTIIDLGVLNLLMRITGIYFGRLFSIFKGISFIGAATNSYFWNKHWTFEKGEKTFASSEYFQFLIVVGVGLLLNVGIASFLVNILGPQFGISEKLRANIGAFVAVFAVFIWNFLGCKFIVFKK